LFLIVLRN